MASIAKRTTVPDTETIRTIYERRAVRKYKNLPVTDVILQKILDAGKMAPSAMNEQPWMFHILTQPETIRQFSKEIGKAFASFLKSGPKVPAKALIALLHSSFHSPLVNLKDKVFYGASVVIFISAPEDNEWASLDTGMCAQNMMLAARSLGLDSCPVGFAKFAEQAASYPLLHIPPTHRIQLAVIIGYGDETPATHKRKRNNTFFIGEG